MSTYFIPCIAIVDLYCYKDEISYVTCLLSHSFIHNEHIKYELFILSHWLGYSLDTLFTWWLFARFLWIIFRVFCWSWIVIYLLLVGVIFFQWFSNNTGKLAVCNNWKFGWLMRCWATMKLHSWICTTRN